MILKNLLEKIIIDEQLSLRKALSILDEAGTRIVLVVDAGRILRGVITDGDVRRYILRNGSLDIPVLQIMNKDFVFLGEGETHQVQESFQKHQVTHIPIVDAEGRVVDLVEGLPRGETQVASQNLPVVVMAGGKGTRLSPITKIIPKPLMLTGDKTMLERIFDNFSAQGFSDFYVIVNYKKELIKSYFSEIDTGLNITFVDEEHYQGTVGGLNLLKDRINSPFILTNCDVLANVHYAHLIDWHFEHNAQLTILGVRKRFDIHYGVVRINSENYVSSIDEKPFFNYVIVSGIYVIDPALFEIIPEKESFGMDQLIRACIDSGRKVACYPINDGWFDMGQFDEYRQLLKHFGVLNV